MIALLYDLGLILLGLIALPKLLWQLAYQKKNRKSFRQRFGRGIPKLPSVTRGPIVWIHTVSLGETRAAIPFYKKMREHLPDALFLISSTTETGHAEAKRSLKEADFYFYLPFDFFWVIKRTVKKLHPDLLILVEGDYWYNLLKYAKKQGARIGLINGKISKRSTNRFKKISFFSHRLFRFLDCLCVQSERYRERFLQLDVDPEKITVTGNLKLDQEPHLMTQDEKQSMKNKWGIDNQDKVIVIGSTHAPEEELLLSSLKNVWGSFPHLKVIIAPRHPERFTEVVSKLSEKGFDVGLYSQLDKDHSKRVIVIDQMGILHNAYALADLAIVGGSFIPWVGGHNIFEPVQLGVPVLFGPHMHSQLDLVELVMDASAGKQISMDQVDFFTLQLLKAPEELKQMARAARQLSQTVRGSTDRTIKKILPLIFN